MVLITVLEMDELMKINDSKEACRLRLEKLKKKCFVLRAVILQHPKRFRNHSTALVNEIQLVVDEVIFLMNLI